ncbi:Putative histone deacetylation protein Rxt3 [Septoria linicola]|uniref:Histone deacetylation protein Rxt3 n=1 Tax=Septoria linicola TaxID=215465 RepID=A0A9Q9AIF6_9PEZI|nr:Putative histone deacetylation protein Rxt3 [Septoria linicola]
MDRVSYTRPGERPNGQHHPATTSSSHPSPYMPSTAQPTQIPFADPFQANRDPFLPGGGRRGSAGVPSRAWPPTQVGNIASQHHSPLDHTAPPPPPPSQSAHPAPLSAMAMPPPYDQTRRRSLGHAGSPQYGAPIEQPPPPPPSYPARAMPPPLSPQNAHPSAHLTSAPRGPPAASPFNGVRELNNSHHRPGMSISAILGGGEERKPPGSPHGSVVGLSSTPRPMQPPSPGRARSSSMRESGDRGMKRSSPSRVFGEPARVGSEPRRDGIFGSPQFRREPAHGFRAFQPHPQEQPHYANGNGAPARPMSQPAEADRLRGLEEAAHRESMFGGRLGGFRPMAEPQPPARSEPPFRQERAPFHNGVTSHPQERSMFHSPQSERDRPPPGPMRYTPLGGTFGGPPREEAAPLFRPAYPPTSHPAPEPPRESIEERAQDARRQFARPSPPPADIHAYDRMRNGFTERPVTLEEHQRMDALQREQQRKESDSSVHKAILNISPEFNRRGRNSPLPQAVQGAQPRHVGPGGDNPGIKMEFGRMFSGLGSGVGSTPHPGLPGNGAGTPSRMSPAARLLDNGDLRRSVEVDASRGRGKAGSRLGRRNNGRRSRDELEDGEGRSTPDAQRGNKRSKTGAQGHHHHHHHFHPHHHHHHHEGLEPGNGGNAPRHSSNPLSQANLAASQAHHHHHHHAHPVGHHHHHPPKAMPPARKPTTTVVNKKVLDELAGKPRKHLGTHLYTTELSPAPAADTPADSKIKYSSKMKPIPVFTGLENSTYTIRVPRYYLTSGRGGAEDNHSLEGICRRRQIWGTDIYTDDSDVVAAAIHSGWLKGDFGDYNEDLRELCDGNVENGGDDENTLTLVERPPKPVRVPDGYDAHITILILPPLESYASTNQHFLGSREWKQKHDGMSFMIHSIEFVDEGATNRFVDRSAAARKNRIAMEEAARREAAAGLLLFASGGSGIVRVGA